MLTRDEILFLLDRLKWDPVFEEGQIRLCKHRGIGYSDERTVARIEGKLSIMLEASMKAARDAHVGQGGTNG